MSIRAGKGARRLRECVRAIYENTAKFEGSGLPRLDVWYASLGRYRPVFHWARREAAYRQLDNTKMFRVVEVSGAGAVELRNSYRDTAPGVVATLPMPAPRRVELPYIPSVKRAFLGVVPARDLVDGVLLDQHKVRRLQLYDENLRDFLGTVRNPVNSEIEETLSHSIRSSQFGVLNNGVTIVVRSLEASPMDILLRGPRVVIGCQTCNVLALNREMLTDNVMVNVRVIESSRYVATLIAQPGQALVTPSERTPYGRPSGRVQASIRCACSHPVKGREPEQACPKTTGPGTTTTT